ncbi:MAG TPA: TolC family protein, partial [Limnobacter sp.]
NTNQYKAGTVSYLNVLTAQTTLLNNQRSALTVQGNRLTAAAALIAALGGGY